MNRKKDSLAERKRLRQLLEQTRDDKEPFNFAVASSPAQVLRQRFQTPPGLEVIGWVMHVPPMGEDPESIYVLTVEEYRDSPAVFATGLLIAAVERAAFPSPEHVRVWQIQPGPELGTDFTLTLTPPSDDAEFARDLAAGIEHGARMLLRPLRDGELILVRHEAEAKGIELCPTPSVAEWFMKLMHASDHQISLEDIGLPGEVTTISCWNTARFLDAIRYTLQLRALSEE